MSQKSISLSDVDLAFPTVQNLYDELKLGLTNGTHEKLLDNGWTHLIAALLPISEM